MASPIIFSRPPPDFTIVSIFRGLQLAIVGAYRTLSNPQIIKDPWNSCWKIIMLCALTLISYSIIQIPLIVTNLQLKMMTWFKLISYSKARNVINVLNFLTFKILNITPYLIMMLKYIDGDIEAIFWYSLHYEDELVMNKSHLYEVRFKNTNYKFASEGIPNLKAPEALTTTIWNWVVLIRSYLPWISKDDMVKPKLTLIEFIANFIMISSRITFLYILSKTPMIGRLVLPITIFQLIYSSMGSLTALGLSLIGFFLPDNLFSLPVITAIFGIRQLLSTLLSTYFKRLSFTKQQLDRWRLSRIGCLTGFGLFYYVLILEAPVMIGAIILAIGQGATAYFITKMTDPPPILSDESISRTSSSARLQDLKTLTAWLDEQCDSTKDYYEELDEMLRDLDSVLPGTLVNIDN